MNVIKMNSVYYVYFRCDEWDSKDSYRLKMVTVDARKILHAIIDDVKDGRAVYKGGLKSLCSALDISAIEEISSFEDDFELTEDQILQIDTSLIYSKLETVIDGISVYD